MTAAAEIAPPPRPAPARAGVRRNAGSLLLGNVVYAGGYWLQFMILARAGGPDAVGTYAYAQALAAPAVGLASLQLRGLLASDARGTYAVREYLALRVAAIAAAMVTVVLLGWATSGAGVLAVLVPVCLMRTAEALSDIYYGAWQLRERMGIIGWNLALNGVGSAGLMAAALALGAGVPGGAAGAAVGSGLAFALVYRRSIGHEAGRPGGSPPVAWRRVLRLATQAAPLGVISLLNAVQSSVPRYFIRSSADVAALGLFAAAYQLPLAGGMVIASVGSAAIPRLAALHAAGAIPAFRALTRRMLSIGALLGGAGILLSALIGRQLLSLLYNPAFAAAGGMLVVLSAAASLTFLAQLQGYALTSARIIVTQTVSLGLAVVVLVAACAILVPRFGGTGAAWAIAVAAAMNALANAAALRLVGRPGAAGVARPSPRAT